MAEWGDWTMYECTYIKRVGGKGNVYTVPDYGEEEGLYFQIRGVAWIVGLGKIIEVHHCDDTQAGSSHDGGGDGGSAMEAVCTKSELHKLMAEFMKKQKNVVTPPPKQQQTAQTTQQQDWTFTCGVMQKANEWFTASQKEVFSQLNSERKLVETVINKLAPASLQPQPIPPAQPASVPRNVIVNTEPTMPLTFYQIKELVTARGN